MKNIKKVSAMLMASVMTVGAVSSMTAGALAHRNSKDEWDVVVENSFLIPGDTTDSDFQYLENTENPNLYGYYISCPAKPNYISAYVGANTDADAIEAAIKEICPDAERIYVTAPYGFGDYRHIFVSGIDNRNFEYSYEKLRQTDVTYEQAIKVYEILKSTGELKKYEYTQPTVTFCSTETAFTTYSRRNQELVENYIAENNLDWYIGYENCDKAFFNVELERNVSAEERYEIAVQIENDLGLLPIVPVHETVASSEDITIEMHDKIDGDANNDGKLTLADAIVTLQSVGNPEKYGINGWDETHITYQGSFNADITGDYDGITSADALAIQRKVLGLE